MNYFDCVIITRGEWVNWLARGYARISQDRIKPFDYTQLAFNHLMSTCVDNNLDDEAFVFVKFNKDFGSHYSIYRTYFNNYIDLTAVYSFYALTERGQRLLTYEAEVSHCQILADKSLELQWENWCNQQLELIRKDKGNKFLSILGYRNITDEKLNILELQKIVQSSEESFKPEQIKKLNEKDKFNIFAWGYITYIFKPLLNDKSFEYIKSLSELESDALSSEDDYLATNSRAITQDRKAIKKIIAFETQLGREGQNLPLLALLVNIHYANLVNQNIEINFKYLKEDLDLLDFYYDSNNYSRQIAYNIGQQLDEVLVNVLYVAHNFDKYEANKTLIDADFNTIRQEQMNFEQISFEQFRKDIIEIGNILNNYNLGENSVANETNDISIEGNTEISTSHELQSVVINNEEKNDKLNDHFKDHQTENSLNKDIIQVQDTAANEPTSYTFSQAGNNDNVVDEVNNEAESANLSFENETQSFTNSEITAPAKEVVTESDSEQFFSSESTIFQNGISLQNELPHKSESNLKNQEHLTHGKVSIALPSNLQRTNELQNSDKNKHLEKMTTAEFARNDSNAKDVLDRGNLKTLLMKEITKIFPKKSNIKNKSMLYSSIEPLYVSYFERNNGLDAVLDDIYQLITGKNKKFNMEELKTVIYQNNLDDLFS